MTKDQEIEADVTHADFLKVMGDVNRGNSPHELSKALEKVVAAVRETGKRGSVTYKLSVAPAGKNTGDQVTVVDDIKADVPCPNRFESIFFATERNTLQREDPRQTKMDFE